MLVVFGAPNPMEDHAERGLRGPPQAMVVEVDRLNGELSGDGLPTIAHRQSGSTPARWSPATVGPPTKRLEFTLIGVPVKQTAPTCRRCGRRAS